MDVMREPLALAGVFVFLWAVLMYVGAPVLIHQTLKQSARPELYPFPPDDPSLPDAEARDFQAVIDELGPEGFEPVTGLTLPSQTPNVKAVLLLLANRQTKDAAMASAMYAITPAGMRRSVFYVAFATRFRDGSVVQTNNSGVPGSFPPRPGHTVGRLPSVQDAARLYRLHRALVARSGSGRKVFRLDEEFRGDAAAYAAATMVEELEDAARAGYMALSPDGETYRPTLKGAFLMTWKQLWPTKGILRAARDRTARRLIAELEGDRSPWA